MNKINLHLPWGAQRLSASQRSAHLLQRAGYSVGEGAQRLSASQRSAPERVALLDHELEVLNAFRHHRGRHIVFVVGS